MEIAKIIILFIVTSQSQMGTDGKPTGVWLEEVTTPYYAFIDAGYEVVVASPQGGQMPIDPRSLQPGSVTESVKRYQQDPAAQMLFANTIPLAQLPNADFAAVFLPGGHGPMWDLAVDEDAGKAVAVFVREGKPVGAVCHGPAGLLTAQDSAGNWLFAGKKLTAFSNAEEKAVGLDKAVPFLLQSELVEKGADYSSAKNFEPYIVIDGNLVTGQNPASAAPAAKAIIELLKNQ